jgi:hypothetical protein
MLILHLAKLQINKKTSQNHPNRSCPLVEPTVDNAEQILTHEMAAFCVLHS